MRWQFRQWHVGSSTRQYSARAQPIIRIDNATFYRKYPSPQDDGATNPPIFPSLTFELPSSPSDQQHWAVIGPSNHGKTTLFEILRGLHLCIPPTARSFPHLSTHGTNQRYRNPARAIQYVGFNGERAGVGKAGTRGAYLSARYESRREETDLSVRDYLQGNTELNPSKEQDGMEATNSGLQKVVMDLNLEKLINMPMSNLSNGQNRRARIARALLGQPMVLLLDEPFMGLDPSTVQYLSKLLHDLAAASAPKLVLSLRPQDPLPKWITHVLRLDEPLRIPCSVEKLSDQEASLETVPRSDEEGLAGNQTSFFHQELLRSSNQASVERLILTETRHSFNHKTLSRECLPLHPLISAFRHSPEVAKREVLVGMKGVEVKYGENVILGDWDQEISFRQATKSRRVGRGLWWNVRRGQRWGIFGSNGSGKTTLISLICSDHPHAYSQPVKIFGCSRLPKPGVPGISIFDIQSRIGQSSPEIHAFFPKSLSIRQTLENAWADTFLGKPQLAANAHKAVDSCLRWFEPELNPAFDTMLLLPSDGDEHFPSAFWLAYPRSTDWADDVAFGHIPFAAQRVALFLRSIIKKPDIVVLDEAFSGMDSDVRNKCLLFLTWGEEKGFNHCQFKGGWDQFYQLAPPTQVSEHHEPMSGLGDEQALICVSHVKEEVPGLVRNWMRLPEPGSGGPPRFGRLNLPLEADEGLWDEIWGL